MTDSAQHWDAVYAASSPERVSWHEAEPGRSLRLLLAATAVGDRVVDVGAGASRLVERLLDAGRVVTVLDLSRVALDVVRARLEGRSGARLEVADVLSWQPAEAYAGWHDRAVFHFLVDPADQTAYAASAARAVRPGGCLVLGVFAQDGPQTCSGLPTSRWTAAELAAVFQPAFTLEQAEREEHRTPAGVVQPFTWVVLRRGTPA